MSANGNGGRAFYFDNFHLIEIEGEEVKFYLVGQTMQNGLSTTSIKPLRTVARSQIKEVVQTAKAMWVSSDLVRKLFNEKKISELGDNWKNYQDLEMQVEPALKQEIIKNMTYLLQEQ